MDRHNEEGADEMISLRPKCALRGKNKRYIRGDWFCLMCEFEWFDVWLCRRGYKNLKPCKYMANGRKR